ncbi:MAG: Mrp/NBP35 family ATP-binding protein [Pirellulaceae bacterium]|nr:Mrp/NBP35 family ATP-binding protein [Pirellulaceae bacterium]
MSDKPLDAAVVQAAARDFKDSETGRGIVEMGQFMGVSIAGQQVTVRLGLTTHSAPLWAEVREEFEQHLRARLPAATQLRVERELHSRPAQPLGEIGLTSKSVIAVGSGKGGVGKSTIAACLALALKRAGSLVGLMDADVYGPSIPHLLGLTGAGRPEIVDNKIQPILADGMPVMSMGFLVPPGEAVVWRGPMLHGAITQFLRDTRWGNLDYLVIDMPPGTGDIALTLSQMLPLTGAVVVCTPQDVALLDAVKAIAMFRKVNIPVLGMVENMSGFECPGCQKRYDIFGRGGARERAEELAVPFLGDVPITMQVREHGDAGTTARLFDESATAVYFDRIAYQLVRNLADQARRQPPMPQLPVLS